MYELELRPVTGEVRAIEEDDARYIIGYGIVFNQWSEDLGGFREIIRPGAEDSALASDLLVAANHDFNFLLGSRAAGTAEIRVDDAGVNYRVRINDDDPLAVSMFSKVKRGDISGSSFQFAIAEDGDKWTIDGEDVRREITRFAEVIEMGPVARPAYPQTSAIARSIVAAITEARQGSVTHESRSLLERAGIDIDAIRASNEDGASSADDDEARAGRARTRRRLSLHR